jgi:hypothetical protein
MTERHSEKPSPAPLIRCACGREELLTPASPQPANAREEDQPARDERPGPQPQEKAVTAGPVKRNEEKH